MKYIGIDYGSKRIGVAISDEEGRIAFPRSILPNDTRLIASLAKLAVDEGARAFVVGDTRSHGGGANPVTDEADAFAKRLFREAGVPVERAFEAWSSIEASRYAPDPRAHDDSAAAAIILQRFLDMRTQ